jgi:hypothetical protein
MEDQLMRVDVAVCRDRETAFEGWAETAKTMRIDELSRRRVHRYCAYYDHSRTHLSLNKDTPIHRPIVAPTDGGVVAIPQVGGLHHRHERQVA